YLPSFHWTRASGANPTLTPASFKLPTSSLVSVFDAVTQAPSAPARATLSSNRPNMKMSPQPLLCSSDLTTASRTGEDDYVKTFTFGSAPGWASQALNSSEPRTDTSRRTSRGSQSRIRANDRG